MGRAPSSRVSGVGTRCLGGTALGCTTFGLGRRFRAHWISHAWFEPVHTMERCLREEIGMLAAAAECSAQDGTARTLVCYVRAIQVFLTHRDTGQFNAEIDKVCQAVMDFVPAVATASG